MTPDESLQETKQWDAEDDLPIADLFLSFPDRALEISEVNLN